MAASAACRRGGFALLTFARGFFFSGARGFAAVVGSRSCARGSPGFAAGFADAARLRGRLRRRLGRGLVGCGLRCGLRRRLIGSGLGRARGWAAVSMASKPPASRREEDSASAPRVWRPACARAAAAARATATAAPGRTWAAARSSPASCRTAPARGSPRAARAAAAATCARRAGARRRWLPLNHHPSSVSPAAPSCTTARRGCRAKIRAARRPRPNVYKPARVLLVLPSTRHHPLRDPDIARWHPPLQSHVFRKT